MRIPARAQFRLLWCPLIAWLVSACLPKVAEAELVTVTITGTVDRGTDVTGVFLSPNTSFTGQSFTLVFTFDDSKGTETVQNCAGVPCGSGDSGTTYTDAPGALLSSLSPGTAVLTINGISFAFGTSSALTSSYSTVGRFLPFEGNPGSVSFDINDYYPNGGAGVFATIFPASGTPPLSTNYDWRSPFTDSQLATDAAPNNGAVNLGSLAISLSNPAIQANANLNFTSITVSSGGGSTTPSEPAKTLGNCGCDVPGAVATGDPISIATGNLFEQVADYATSGPNQLGFTRYYNSLGSSTTTFAASLGTNWRSNYDRYLRIVSATSVTAERADGQQLTFTSSGGAWASDSDVDLKLVNSGSTWTLTDTTDTVETYTAGASGEALLTTIAARNGYTQTLHYNASNQLVSVTDSYNRSLTLAYQNGLLQTVTTPDGLILTYGYSSSGVTPGVLDRLASVAYSTTPQTSQSYLYENSALPFALTGIIDEDGNRYATWTYDSSGRGLTSQHAGGADLTTVVYNDPTAAATVTNALGPAVTVQIHDSPGRAEGDGDRSAGDLHHRRRDRDLHL